MPRTPVELFCLMRGSKCLRCRSSSPGRVPEQRVSRAGVSCAGVLRKFAQDILLLSRSTAFPVRARAVLPVPLFGWTSTRGVSGTCPPSIKRFGARLQEQETPNTLFFMMRFSALSRMWYTVCSAAQ